MTGEGIWRTEEEIHKRTSTSIKNEDRSRYVRLYDSGSIINEV